MAHPTHIFILPMCFCLGRQLSAGGLFSIVALSALAEIRPEPLTSLTRLSDAMCVTFTHFMITPNAPSPRANEIMLTSIKVKDYAVCHGI
ncbi:MAG: hypothetical protein ACKOPC_06290 [Methylocystis sp.]